MKLGIIGNGFVGKASQQLNCAEIDLLIYDINPDLCIPKNTSLKDMKKCDIIFVCVPTPMNKNGSCYLDIVNNVIKDLKKIIDPSKNFIVIRSTVPPGTSNKLNVYFMPEFLTEKNYINDFIMNKNWIFGLLNDNNDETFKNKISNLFNLAFKHKKIQYNSITFIDNSEAELVKYCRNCFLATKVAFCNEIEQLCTSLDINYENVRKMFSVDPRIGDSHTNVPGHDGKRGYGGTCFPKDMNAMIYFMKKQGIESFVLKSANTRNETIDRIEKDWNENKGRAVIE